MLVSIGDLQVTQYHLHTPNGTYPLAGSTWMLQNSGTWQTRTPTWAVILMIAILLLFFWTLVGFAALFLLAVKETTYSGYLQIIVQGPGLYHATQVPFLGPQTEADMNARVNYVRGLVSQAGPLTGPSPRDGNPPPQPLY